jgi:hypothetical protein
MVSSPAENKAVASSRENLFDGSENGAMLHDVKKSAVAANTRRRTILPRGGLSWSGA